LRNWAGPGAKKNAFSGVCCVGGWSDQLHRSGYRRPGAKARRFGAARNG
jgi:hypothetical protein